MARPQKFRHSREALNDPAIAMKLAGFVLDIEALRAKRQQIDDQIAAAYDLVDDAGFEKKFVRKNVALRAKETVQREDEEHGLAAYEEAIEKGVSLVRTRRERFGAPGMSAYLRKEDMPAHDAETGEIIEPALPTQPSAATAGDGPTQAPSVTGSTLQESHAVVLPPAAKPEPVVPPLAGSGAIPDELIVAHIRKDHQPTNPQCQRPATCKWARSMASCSACANAAAAKRKLVPA